MGLAFLMVFAIAGVYYIETTLHIIERKLIMREGSFGTRANDTISDFMIALSRPLLGYGMFNTYTHEALLRLGVTDNSNWFATVFMYFGIPLAIVYFSYFAYRLRRFFDCGFLSFILIFAAFCIFMNTENMGVMTLFMAFLFPVIQKNKQIIRNEKKEGIICDILAT